MNKKVIIFDFDGVMVSSMHLSYSINKGTIPDLEYEEWQSWFEGNLYDKIRKEFVGNSADDTFFEKYNAGLANLKPIQALHEVIEELAKEYILVIISSATQTAITDFLGKNAMKEYFNDVLGKEVSKSKIDKFRIVLEKYQIKSAETLMITDTVGDIKEANGAGIKSLGVTWGVHNGSKLKEASPNFIATKPSDIIAGIKSLLGS